MKINFFTIVLNGMPFIKQHIDIFNKLSVPWHWHIIEGVASLVKDTGWSVKNGGKIDNKFHKKGLSIDGTTEYIDKLKEKYPDKITVYRKENGEFWNGKVEMCNAPILNLNEECLLFQIDVDEVWQSWMIEKIYKMFLLRPDKYSAWFYCKFFVGKDIVVSSKNNYGNNPSIEWLRVWRFIPGMLWLYHEPPTLVIKQSEKYFDVGKINPFTHEETEANGLIFDHYAYFLKSQLEFKEKYYGYENAVNLWIKLNNNQNFPVYLKEYFHWVKDNAVVDKVYKFKSSGSILIVRTDAIGDHVIFSSGLRYFRKIFKGYKIFLLTQEHIKDFLEKCPYIDEIVPFNRSLAINSVSYLNQVLNFLQSKNFDIAIYPVYSREVLGDILTIDSNAKFKIGINGNLERTNKVIKLEFDRKYDMLIDISSRLNELEKNRFIVSYLVKMFNTNITIEDFSPDVWIEERDTKNIEKILKKYNLKEKEFIVISPTSLVPIKFWSVEKWKLLINALKEIPIVLNGANSEKNYIKKILVDSKHKKLLDLTGLSIKESAYLFSLAKLHIGLDSAPCHISTAVETPTIIIMGGGYSNRFFPYSNLQYPVFKKMDCFGCNWRCKFDSIKCIELIETEDVINAINKVLGGVNAKS